ncbi:hypothetical protein J5N97_007881 [Dioscorea zingiberensis]|uniref:Uncharacterized protein n=1 Tax=Dioscorea zingiberensis TaxID=325984 RepID=A0A9D5DD89_9LILI|nr:hypothetical protein J5N97_007881 [Dioscorea zingiberensis]
MESHRRSGDPLRSPPSKAKFRVSAFFSCCFQGAASSEDADDRPASSFSWLRAIAPEIRDRRRSIISRFRMPRFRRGDFRYDPIDYALNFDEGNYNSGGDGVRCQGIVSRLPTSPNRPFRQCRLHSSASRPTR